MTRPDDMNTDVVLTATLSKGAAADQTKTFTLTVIISASGSRYRRCDGGKKRSGGYLYPS